MQWVIIIFGLLVLALILFSLFKINILRNRVNKEHDALKVIQAEVAKREGSMNRRMYELAILKELGDRIGYSLDVHQIIDIITGSLHQFIEYSAVSYMLLEPEKVIFKVHLEKSVHRKFIEEVRDRMLKSLSALLDREIKQERVEEILSGAILIEELDEPVRSFFNIPIVIGNKVVGVLTVAHTEAGLYKDEEMTILYKITQQASAAVSRLQEVVKTEQGKLNAMVSSMTEGVIMTDKHYHVVVVNPVAKSLIGMQNKEEITIFDFIDNLEGKFDIRGKLEESVKLDKILETNDVLINDRFYQIFVSPVKSKLATGDDEILGGVVIFQDITNEKEVEKLRKDFTSMMVHELRSPLGGIRNMTELIINRKEDIDEKKLYGEYIPNIFKSSSEMLELVNDLLDAAKIESGEFSIQKEKSSIITAISDRIKFFETLASSKSIVISTHFTDDIKDTQDFDPQRISQVLNNLISNALKFTETGGRIDFYAFSHNTGQTFDVELEKMGGDMRFKDQFNNTSNIQNSLVVAVSDTGAGISKDEIGQLFNKFKQFRASRLSEAKGTGLGLVIIKGIIEAHGGTVGVASKESIGSLFYFTIPLNINK